MTIKKKTFLTLESYFMNSLRPVICNFYKFPRISCDCIIFCKFPPPPSPPQSLVKTNESQHQFKGMN